MDGLGKAWAQLPETVQSRLIAGGTSKDNCAALENMFEDEEDCRGLIRQLGLDAKGVDEERLLAAFLALREAARAAATLKRRKLSPTIMIQHRGQIGVVEEQLSLVRLATARGALGGMIEDKLLQPRKWRTRRQQRIGQHDGDPAQRATVEEEERMRWAAELAQLLEEAKSPRFEIASTTLDPASSMRHCAGATRARTIRLRVRAWRKYRFWLMCAKGHPWPGTLAEVLDYLDDLCNSGCARTVPDSWLSALGFMEEKGGYPLDKRFSLQPVVISTVRSIAASLATGAAPTRKAPALFVKVLISLELYICDVEQPRFLRGFAWLKLIKVWGALRTNDLQGICPHHLRCTESGLLLLIDRSKTSGPGKRMRWLPAYVAAGATITGLPWLQIGYELWQSEALSYPRDYLLPLPTEDMVSVLKKPAGYSDSAALSRRLLGSLRGFVVQKGKKQRQPASSVERLLRPDVVDYFKEHGDRNVINSLAACLEVEKSQRDFLGRWRPQQSDDYLRTHKAVVRRIQLQVVEAIRSDDARIDESENFAELKDYLKEKGWQEAQVAAQLKRLQTTTGLGPAAPPVAPDSSGSMDMEIQAVTGEDSECLEEEGHPEEQTEDRACCYIISYSNKRRFRRLHLNGGCWRRPERDLLDFAYCETVRAGDFDAACKDCWPKGHAPSLSSSGYESEDSNESDSSSTADYRSQGEADV